MQITRYYTTHSLLKYLMSKGHYYTGTLQINRKNFPAEVKTAGRKLAFQESRYFRSESGILLVMWKDKKASKPVVAVSTKDVAGSVDVITKRGKTVLKPNMINNLSMNGCDRLDQNVSYYNNLNRRTLKWWKRIFAWLLEVSQVNAHILFLLTREQYATPMPLKHFKEKLIDELCEKAYDLTPADFKPVRRGRPRTNASFERFEDKPHLIGFVDQDRNCCVCSTAQSRKCTKFICTGCSDKPYLHPKDCFIKYHS